MAKIKYGSVCSGVEAASVAWEPLGWEPEWFCEFDKFPSAVLAHRFPDVPNLHDMTQIENRKEYHDRPIDLLVGGTPCQSFSVAGLRKGLDDERGNLALKFCQILADKKPRWFVWENVPGCLSSSDGRDFAAILSGFSECGYSFAYRVLDAQYFGVPQRRRRVFVVGYLGDWRPPAAVLFEPSSLRGDPAPIRGQGKDAACYTPASFGTYRQGCGTLTASGGDLGGGSDNLIVTAIQGNLIGRGVEAGPNGVGCQDDLMFTLTTKDIHAVCFEPRSQDGVPRIHGDIVPTLNTMAGGQREPCVYNQHIVRKMTPIECERSQGFPDNWTQIPWRGKPAEMCPDGPRYKTMGNSMAVPVMHWIGKRIDTFENLSIMLR